MSAPVHDVAADLPALVSAIEADIGRRELAHGVAEARLDAEAPATLGAVLVDVERRRELRAEAERLDADRALLARLRGDHAPMLAVALHLLAREAAATLALER